MSNISSQNIFDELEDEYKNPPCISDIGFQIDTIFGKAFIGHFAPLNKEPQYTDITKEIFRNNNIILGDMNTNEFNLVKRNIIDDTNYRYLKIPSYLPYIDDNRKTTPMMIYTPRFDNVIVNSNLSVFPAKYQMYNFPFKLDAKPNPKSYIQYWNLVSDHAPIEAVVIKNNKIKLNVATFNVCDPLYYTRFYDDAHTMGFDINTEHIRKKRIIDMIQILINKNNIVGLQEVPYDIIPSLSMMAKHYNFDIIAEESPSEKDTDEFKLCPHNVSLIKDERMNKKITTPYNTYKILQN